MSPVSCKTVKLKSMIANELSTGEHVQQEEEGAENQALGNTFGERGSGGFPVV